MKRYLSLLVLLFLVFVLHASAQHVDNYSSSLSIDPLEKVHLMHIDDRLQEQSSDEDTLPSPKSVMYKSMIIPGWGQITNKQIWKVPIVYGLLGGLAWFSSDLTKRYHDYRAAYYNLNEQTDNDQRFGPTPDYIPETASLEQLKTIRNTYRNRRDMAYIGIALAYGLNIVDAYVFAHMRSFDVSDDLSMRTRIKPSITAKATPGFTLSIDFITK